MNTSTFRFLVILTIVGALLLTIGEAVFPNESVTLVQEYADSLNSMTVFDALNLTSLSIVVLLLVSLLVAITYGLYTFKNWARWANLYFILVLIPFAFMDEVMIYGPISTLANEILAMLEGAIIALSFYSPIANEFEKKT